MSKKSGRAIFYELGTGQDAPGKFSRRHIVRCNKCSSSTALGPSLTDAQLRKKLVSMGWKIGRLQNQHLCPKHAVKGEVRNQSTITVHELPLQITTPTVENLAPADRSQEFIEWFHGLPQSEQKNVLAMIAPKQGPSITTVKPPKPLPELETVEPDAEEMHVADIIFGKQKEHSS